jgi:glycosyltransferase involved in cell wall biosynthesis
MEWGWAPDRFVYIPNAIDTSKFIPSYHPGRSFSYIGRLSNEKGLDTLVRAIAKSGASLNIVGFGPEEQRLRELVSELNANVMFLGYLSGERLHNVIKESRAIILPSEWYENAPLSILEAYALGKPVIGASIGGIPELIHDENTGKIFSPGSVDELAEKILEFMQASNEKISSMGKLARELVETTFHMKMYGEKMQKLYETLGVS